MKRSRVIIETVSCFLFSAPGRIRQNVFFVVTRRSAQLWQVSSRILPLCFLLKVTNTYHNAWVFSQILEIWTRVLMGMQQTLYPQPHTTSWACADLCDCFDQQWRVSEVNGTWYLLDFLHVLDRLLAPGAWSPPILWVSPKLPVLGDHMQIPQPVLANILASITANGLQQLPHMWSRTLLDESNFWPLAHPELSHAPIVGAETSYFHCSLSKSSTHRMGEQKWMILLLHYILSQFTMNQ